MLTWIALALIRFQLTAFPGIAWRAVTDVVVDPILTKPIVDARIGGTFVNVTQAPWTVESSRTLALETVDEVNALSSVGTRVTCALAKNRENSNMNTMLNQKRWAQSWNIIF
jgi:hypothetical protein